MAGYRSVRISAISRFFQMLRKVTYSYGLICARPGNEKRIRKKRGGKKLPEDSRLEVIIHDLSPVGKKCRCCGNKRLETGPGKTEELDIIPAQIQVIKHMRKKIWPLHL